MQALWLRVCHDRLAVLITRGDQCFDLLFKDKSEGIDFCKIDIDDIDR